MLKVKDIEKAIEAFAPRCLQEDYDNSGLQVGDREMPVHGILLCLDVTEDILREAKARKCNMIVSHHPLLFSGLKQITGADPIQRIAMEAIRQNIAIYAAHTNLDAAGEGVSYEIANSLGVHDTHPLQPSDAEGETGLGVIGEIPPTPKLEFLRKVKECLNIQHLRYSGQSPQLVVRKVAVCGGAGASMIRTAIAAGADIYLTGDIKYHDYTSYAHSIILADIGHFESELCTKKMFWRILRENFPDCVMYFSETEQNPVAYV